MLGRMHGVKHRDWPGMTALFSRDGRFLFVRGLGRARGSDQQPTRNYLFIDTASLRDRTFSVLERADITAARFSSDGRFLGVAARDRSVRIFELPSGKLVTQISSDFAVTSIVFSHSPHYLGLASGSPSPRIYQLPGGVEVTRAGLQEKERLLAFHFAEDERSLILASTSLGSVEDATDKSQEVSIERQYLFSEDLIREGCARVSRNLTWEEWKSYLPDYPYEKTCLDLPGPGKQR